MNNQVQEPTRRTPQTNLTPGKSLTEREKPRDDVRRKAQEVLPEASAYSVKLLYGVSYTGPGEWIQPKSTSQEKIRLTEALRASKKYDEGEVIGILEKTYPTTAKRRGRLYFVKGVTHITQDKALAEIYRKMMTTFSKDVVDGDGFHNTEFRDDRVNRFSVIPLYEVKKE